MAAIFLTEWRRGGVIFGCDLRKYFAWVYLGYACAISKDYVARHVWISPTPGRKFKFFLV